MPVSLINLFLQREMINILQVGNDYNGGAKGEDCGVAKKLVSERRDTTRLDTTRQTVAGRAAVANLINHSLREKQVFMDVASWQAHISLHEWRW